MSVELIRIRNVYHQYECEISFLNNRNLNQCKNVRI